MQTIFIHGLGQAASSWQDTLKEWEQQTQVICPELSELLGDQEATYEHLYQNFINMLEAYQAPFNLCGLSLGAVLALNYALDYPERVNTLVLIAGQYKMPKQLLKFQNLIFRLLPQSVFGEMGMRKQDFITLTDSMSALNFSNRLKTITCPALVVCGTKDMANKKASQNLATHLSNAQLQWIEGAKHEINREAPQALAAVIQKFHQEVHH